MRVRVTDSRGLHASIDVEQLGQLVPIVGLDRLLQAAHGEKVPLDTCPICGWTETEAEESGLMGCGFCHTVFSALRERLQKLNSGA